MQGTKNPDKWLQELLTRITSLQKNINDLMELKNTARELSEAYTSISSRIDQMEEGISEIEDQLNEIKLEDKIREKRMKRNEQSLQEMWDYVKRPNPHLIGVPESDRDNGTKLENTLQDIHFTCNDTHRLNVQDERKNLPSKQQLLF